MSKITMLFQYGKNFFTVPLVKHNIEFQCTSTESNRKNFFYPSSCLPLISIFLIDLLNHTNEKTFNHTNNENL